MILSGRDIQWYIERKKLIVRPIESNQFRQNGIDLILQDVDREEVDENRKWLGRNEFCLGVTREWIELPDDLMAFVQLRSTWARSGFLLPPTIVDAGFKGTLTLEIVSYKHQTVPIGQRFAHLIFAKMASPSEPYDGKYQGQVEITPSKAD